VHVRRALFPALLFTTISSAAFAQDSLPPKPTTTASVDLGFVSATGNTELTTLNVGEKVAHTEGRFLFSQLGVFVYGETKKVQSAEDLRSALRADVAWTPRVGGFAGVAYERNTYAGYNSRIDEIAGVLTRVLVEPEDSLSVDLGGVLTQQQNVDSTSQRIPSARAAMNYKHSFSKTSYFQQLAEYLPDLQNGGQYRLNTESSLVAPISSHVGVKVSYAFRYDSNPPANFGSTDRVLTTGVQISY
jgi:putative salt-induced outer membrane protein